MMPIESMFTQVHIERLRVGVRQRISRQVAESMRLETFQDMITNDLVAAMMAELLAERLPPEHVDHTITFDAPRFATWREHFRATYRERWWGRLLRLRAPRYIDEPISHTVRVDVRSHWTYPQATTVLPGRDFGHVVLRADTSAMGGHRWF